MDWPDEWNDVNEVNLYTLESNVKAVAVYAKWGFKVVDKKLNYYVGHHALKMAKPIEQSFKPNKFLREC